MGRILRRLSAIVVAPLFAVVIASPSAASAAEPSADEVKKMLGRSVIMDQCPAPNDPTVRWTRLFGGIVLFGFRYIVISSTPAFYASDGRAVDNLLTDPVSATFTSSVSHTTTLTTTVGNSAQFLSVLQTTVSTSIVDSRTTAIGVNATVTVPPRTRVTGLYGIDGFDIVYEAQVIFRDGGNCTYGELRRGFTQAPTFVEGWRFSSIPI
jgi:hypothetical protein